MRSARSGRVGDCFTCLVHINRRFHPPPDSIMNYISFLDSFPIAEALTYQTEETSNQRKKQTS